MTTKTSRALEGLNKIKYLYMHGKLSFDDAKFFAEPLLKELNAELEAKKKEIGDKRKGKVTFTGFMR